MKYEKEICIMHVEWQNGTCLNISGQDSHGDGKFQEYLSQNYADKSMQTFY